MSNFYEERLQRDLDDIRGRVAALARDVEQALQQATKALLHHDKKLANEVVLHDMPINRASRQLDSQCHAFIARHLPSAGHLRFISSVLRLNISLERIGDYAVTIAREAKTVQEAPEANFKVEIVRMANESINMFRQAMQAFNERNPSLAQGTKILADEVDHSFQDAFNLLLREGKRPDRDMAYLLGMFIAFNRYERVSDQAKNICEEAIFAASGRVKPPKVYRILFLDEHDNSRSQMAVAIAKRYYPHHGDYTSAGLHPAERVHAACAQFMESYGHPLNGAIPRRFDEIPEDWKDNHVVISLQGPIEKYIEHVPFHTISLEWDIPPAPSEGLDVDTQKAAYETIYRDLVARIGNLIETLHGQDEVDSKQA